MAEKKLSPRQRMINMMYLVLTALLALNVSKEVLQSFFEVNTGIVRTTSNFDSQNSELYYTLDNAASQNPIKYKEVRDQAFEIKEAADILHESIQKMKYELVKEVDPKVALGDKKDLLDEKGKLKEDAGTTAEWSELSDSEKKKKIGYLSNKKNRSASGKLFLTFDPLTENEEDQEAFKLKKSLLEYRDLLNDRSQGNITLINSINDVFDIDRSDFGKTQNQSWEQYNFEDMPAVGALTILSKIQSDIRNMESNVVSFLGSNLIAGDLKFDAGAEAIHKSPGVVFINETFNAEIFLAAKNSQNPQILVGEYDSLSDGRFEMRGEYETIEVRNGKGYYSTKATTQGMKEWGGLIIMKTETGDKKYPFKGSYMVHKVEGIVSIDMMNKVFRGFDNPITVSVPGYTADKIDVRCSDCQTKPKKINGKKGEWTINPKTLTKTPKDLLTLYVKGEDGAWKKMGTKALRVIKVPDPKITFGLGDDNKGSRAEIIMGRVYANSGDKDLAQKIKYKVLSYSWKKGAAKQYTDATSKDGSFDDKFKKGVESSQIGQSMIIKDVVYKQKKCPSCKPIKMDDKYVIEIE